MLDCYFPTVPMVADIVVLAEDAAQITTCEEYRAGTTLADKDAFLTEVWANGTNNRQFAYAAKANLALTAVHSAPAWA
jgi:hypothetical protein